LKCVPPARMKMKIYHLNFMLSIDKLSSLSTACLSKQKGKNMIQSDGREGREYLRFTCVAVSFLLCLLVGMTSCGQTDNESTPQAQKKAAGARSVEEQPRQVDAPPAQSKTRPSSQSPATKTVILNPSMDKNKPGALRIQGLYLGMPISDAKRVLEEMLGRKLAIRESTGDRPYSIWDPKGDTGVEADGRGRVQMIRIAPSLANKLFKAYRLTGYQFKEHFARIYGLGKMKPFEKRVQNIRFPGWRIRIGGRDQLTIYQIKMVELKRAAS